MPRYFFHVEDGKDIPDEDGVVLSGPDEACNQAVIVCGEMLRELGGDFWNGEDWIMRVTDDQGAPVCELKFSGIR